MIDIYVKYAWVVHLKEKNGITINNAFPKILHEYDHKPNRIWVNKGEFCNKSAESWLQDNDIEMYSTHNEGKSVVAERIIRTLKMKFTNIWLLYQKMFALID